MELSRDRKIYIIGAGVSGLIAAQNLEKHGYSPIILEAKSNTGGRVRTEIIDGWILDVGFQVLLDAYPMSKKYLNYDDLDLQKLTPGAHIYTENNSFIIGDPLRNIKLLFPTLFSSVGSFIDKLKIFQLNLRLKYMQIEAIFNEKETTTLTYLQNLGFSDKVINQFFKPFFSGILLEPDLRTSSRMFEFIFKLFSKGNATLPKAGIGAIADQLVDKLKTTEIQLNSKVQKLKTNLIVMASGESYTYDMCIVATEPSNFLDHYSVKNTWKKCDNLYYIVPRIHRKEPLIHLSAISDSLINNVFFPTSVQESPDPNHDLVSVTVVKHHMYSTQELAIQVKLELEKYFFVKQARFIKHYKLSMALPDLESVSYIPKPRTLNFDNKILLCGDHTVNGSLNAAILSGELAAKQALKHFKNRGNYNNLG